MQTRYKLAERKACIVLPLFYKMLNSQSIFFSIYQFLNLLEVGNIDIVFNCSHEIKTKTNYFDYIKENFASLNIRDEYCISESFGKWLMRRRICLQHISFLAFEMSSHILSQEWLKTFCSFYQMENQSNDSKNKLLSLRFLGSDLNFQMFIRCCKHLKNINLEDSTGLNDDSILLLCQHCPALESINLSACFNILEGFALFPVYCPKIEMINISKNFRVNDEIILRLTPYSQLKSLNLQDCSKITGSAIALISAHFRNLKILNIRGCCQLMDLDILPLAECVNLEELHLGAVRLITDNAILEITKKCIGIQKLFLSGIPNITDKAICKIAENFPKLRELDTAYNSLITDVSIVQLADKCPNLTYLDLSGLTKLTDESVIQISNKSVKLEDFRVKKIIGITDNFIYHLTKVGSCPSLLYLHLSGPAGPNRVTKDAVKCLVKQRPNIWINFYNKSYCGNTTD
jgi:F-box/leucine-rich repeat protein 2/20